MSRSSPAASTPSPKPSPKESPKEQRQSTSDEQPSSPHRTSGTSEGYPSWLPKRPPPPAPASTFHSSSIGMYPDTGANDPYPPIGGRKPTPRSVRIVSLQDSEKDPMRREPTDQTRVPSSPAHQRVWSRATGTALSPTVYSTLQRDAPRPRFRAATLHLELLRSPDWPSWARFYFFPLFVLGHIPLQTFFDFNAVFILVQVAKFPNPVAPGVPGSGRNWALGAAAYIGCWATWIFAVCIIYEFVYSFFRRWRTKRPLILPIYLSSPASSFASLTSYTHFCFIQHLRINAFKYNLRDGLAETCWLYSQNLPTVALLLPRAGLCVALLLAFTRPLPDFGVNAGEPTGRDATFFRTDGTLSGYARGVLFANAAWTAWRVLVLLASWLGLWILSGHACAGLCGPRYRWEEESSSFPEKLHTKSLSDDELDDEADALPWAWKTATRARILDAWEFCLTTRPHRRKDISEDVKGKGVAGGNDLLGASPDSAVPFEGMEQVLAAVGFPSVPAPSRRGVLSEDLFAVPGDKNAPELSAILPPVGVAQVSERDAEGPLITLPYPFKGYGPQSSSGITEEQRIPFPPSPVGTDSKEALEAEQEEGGDDEEELEIADDEEEEEEEEEPSSGRASGSMSSLGQPVVSRYPFQYRRPLRGTSFSSHSHMSPGNTSSPSTTTASHSHSHSTPSRVSRSTGNGESISTGSPMSRNSASPGAMSHSHFGAIPMPPRHPRTRTRAGTVPSIVTSTSGASSSPITFASPGTRGRTRTESGATDAYGYSFGAETTFDTGVTPDVDPEGEPEEADVTGAEDVLESVMMEQPEAEGSHEAAEREDSVGLLSPGPSPKASFVGMRQQRRAQSRSQSQSGSSSSRSRTASSLSTSARSRAQSMVQSIGAASRSSLELVQSALHTRTRANSSMARLAEDTSYYSGNGHSRSGSGSDAVLSSPENHTFGHPLRNQWREEEAAMQARISEESREEEVQEEARAESPSPPPSSLPSEMLPGSRSTTTVAAPSEHDSYHTVSRSPERSEPAGIPIPSPTREGRREDMSGSSSSHPDISTAAGSFVTAPATAEGTTSSSSGRTPSSWGGMSPMGAHALEGSGQTWRPA